MHASASTLSNDLMFMQDGAYQWKMPFNVEKTKQTSARDLILWKNKLVTDPTLFFNKFKTKFVLAHF